MHRKMNARLAVALSWVALLAAPSAAHADASWTCSAATGWTAANAQRSNAPAIGADPCPSATAPAGSATGIAADGSLRVDGGGASQTTDTRRPQASVDAKTVSIRNGDGSLAVDASKLSVRAEGVCDASRQPSFTSGGNPGTV
ncbi:MAG TPA: hypothetical protein VF066_05050, partial [Thermoleophilaceae bacterium]